MAITYRTVIKNAIDGFNSIQSKIYTYSGQLSAPSATDSTKIFSINEIVGALKEAGVSVNGEISSGVGTLSQLAPASGELYTLATSAYSITSSQDTTDGSNYYIRLSAGGSGTVTPTVTTTAGLVKSETKSGSAITTSGSSTKYVKIPKAEGSVQSVEGSVTYASLMGLTLSTSDTSSGITFTPKATNVSRRYKYTTAGYIPADTTPGDNSGTLTGSAQYVTDVTVPAGKTLSSVSLTSGGSSANTYLTTLNINEYTTVSNLNLTGIITTLSNTGIIENLTGANNRILTLGGTTTITNVGSSSTSATLNVTTNTYGTINVWGTTAGDKMVRVANHTVTVDGTTVTDVNGDLKTSTLNDATISGATVTISTSGTGWIGSTSKSGTIPSGALFTSEKTENNVAPSGYTENTTAIVPTKGWLLIGAGYYPATAISLDTMLGGREICPAGVSVSSDGKLTVVASAGDYSGITISSLAGEPLLLSGNLSNVTYNLSNSTIDVANASGTLNITNGNNSSATITADNLVASNIKEGVNILGVTGTLVEGDIGSFVDGYTYEEVD